MGALYQIVFPNGKRYIGMTESVASRRWLDHRYHARMGHKGVVYDAIRKHGVENARFEILVVADGRDYLADLERGAIRSFGTRAPLGYNVTDGGDGAPCGHKYRVGLKHSAASKAKMSKTRQALGFHHTEETKARIGEASRGNKYSEGTKHDDVCRSKITAGNRGKSKGASSGHVGVSLHKISGRWRAHITVNYKFIDLGYHASVDLAVSARRNGEERYFHGR